MKNVTEPARPEPAPRTEPECHEGPEAFDRFKALARKLVRVPKRELDDARERSEKERTNSNDS